MELKTAKLGSKTISYREFDSIHEFVEYIEGTPLNDVFKWQSLQSVSTSDYSWYTTHSYEEAKGKLHYGDKKLAEKLTGTLKVEKHAQNMIVQKPRYDVAGYQASVPRYLQGIPTSMINKKSVTQKQKVVTITKNIGYTAMFSGQNIINEAIKAVQLINTIEAHGIRCNLYVASIAESGSKAVGFRVKIKSAGERLNISKLAFPLANPSMLRRFSFRYREVAPETPQSFAHSYGTSINTSSLFNTKKGEYYIPTMVSESEMDALLNSIIK